MIATRKAVPRDAEAISALLVANERGRGGALHGDWSVNVVTRWIRSGALIVVATQGPRLVGTLLTSEKAQASTPPVLAMLAAWPGRDDAYVYGPVCVDRPVREMGVLEVLYAEVSRRLADREAILFINEQNEASLRAHAKLGFKRVSSFQLDEEAYLIFSSVG